MGVDAQEFFSHPASYRGKTVERALELAENFESRMADLRARCESERGKEP
jgi:hypothetical protein